jgi:hypothetical protein
MVALPCRAEKGVEAGSAALRVDWPVYPRWKRSMTLDTPLLNAWSKIRLVSIGFDHPALGRYLAISRGVNDAGLNPATKTDVLKHISLGSL